MTFSIRNDGAITILAIEGELDAVSVSDLREALDRIVMGPTRLTIDLSRLRLIDSSGVGALVYLYKRLRAQGGEATVTGLRDQPLAIFKLLRLDRVMQDDASGTPAAARAEGHDPGPYIRTAPDLGEAVHHARERGRGATLLIGAGCSASAGIKTAAGVVEIITSKFPRTYRRQPLKTYAALMAELTIGERHDLIAELIRGALPNFAHRAIASLMREGYVRRVLTTNFDDLVQCACAQAKVQCFASDLSTLEQYDPSLVREPAVFYLHGRDGGFVQHHTDPAMRQHAAQLGPVLADAIVGRPFLVVGYSGMSDPVFDRLAGIPRFTYGLYWATYQRQLPEPHVAQALLQPSKQAYFVPATDADELFSDLCGFLKVAVAE